MRTFLILFSKEWHHLWCQKSTFFSLLSFSMLTLLLFVIANGQGATFGPAMLWVILLFAATMMVPLLFDDDFKDGTLEQLYTANIPFEWMLLAKICRHSLSMLVLAMVLLVMYMVMFHVKQWVALRLLASFLLGIPSISALSTFSGVFGLAAASNRFVLSILVLPLMIPTLIFACAVITPVSLNTATPIWLLMACSLFSVPVSLLASVFVVKAALRDS